VIKLKHKFTFIPPKPLLPYNRYEALYPRREKYSGLNVKTTLQYCKAWNGKMVHDWRIGNKLCWLTRVQFWYISGGTEENYENPQASR
jgi:hypothetical protein